MVWQWCSALYYLGYYKIVGVLKIDISYEVLLNCPSSLAIPTFVLLCLHHAEISRLHDVHMLTHSRNQEIFFC